MPMGSQEEHITHSARPGNETLPYADRVLTTQRLRHLLKHRRTSLIPESLAEFMRGAYPEIYDADAAEISEILIEMVDGVRVEVESAGIVSEPNENEPTQVLSFRERNLLANFAALLTWTSGALGLMPPTTTEENNNRAKRIALQREAIMWAKIATDVVQIALCMNQLATSLQREVGELDTAAELIQEAIELLRTSCPPEAHNLLASLLGSQTRLLFETGRLQEAESVINESLIFIQDNPETVPKQTHVAALLLKGSIANNGKEYSTAMTYWQEGLQQSDSQVDPLTHCALLQSMAMLYERMEHPEKGLEMLLKAISTLEANGLAANGAWVYVTAVESYHRRREFDRAFDMLERVESILGLDPANLPDTPNQIAVNVFVTHANVLFATKEFPEAVRILKWAIDKATEIEFYSTAVAACAILAEHFGKQGSPDQSCLYLEHALSVAHGGSSRYNQLRLLLSLANWKIQIGDYQRAGELLDEVERDIEPDSRLLPKVQRRRAELAESAGNFAEALAFERSAAMLEQKVFAQNRERSIRYARIIAELDMLEKSVEQEKEQRRQLELELTQALVKLSEKERMIDDIRKIAGSVPAESRANKTNQRTMNHAIISILDSESRKDHLSLEYLAMVDEGFVNRVRLAYPELTPKLERLAVLLRAGLNANEIGTLMEIGSEGLKTLRKRLRKSFGLVKGESLEHKVAEI